MKIFKINKRDYVTASGIRQLFKELLAIMDADGVVGDSQFHKDWIDLKVVREVTHEEANNIFVVDERVESDEVMTLQEAFNREIKNNQLGEAYMLATSARITYLARYSVDICSYRVTRRKPK